MDPTPWRVFPLSGKKRRGQAGRGEKTRKIKREERDGEDENQVEKRDHLRRIDRVIRLGDGVVETTIGAIRVLGGTVMVVMDKSLGGTRQSEKGRDRQNEKNHPAARIYGFLPGDRA